MSLSKLNGTIFILFTFFGLLSSNVNLKWVYISRKRRTEKQNKSDRFRIGNAILIDERRGNNRLCEKNIDLCQSLSRYLKAVGRGNRTYSQ